MGDFLNNLKKDVDAGDFNSEAARKIIDINNLADGKSSKDFEKRMNDIKPISLNENDALTNNLEYEKKMSEIKQQDMINSDLALLIDIENTIKLCVDDMSEFISEIEGKFMNEFNNNNPIFNELKVKISEIKNNFNI